MADFDKKMDEGARAPARVPLWQWLVAGGLLATGVYSCMGRPSGPTAAQSQRSELVAAFGLCRDAIRSHSKDPERAVVPLVDNAGREAEFYFAWGPESQMLRLRNGLGLEVSTSGSCTVDSARGRVTGLTLNGRSLLDG